MTTPYQQLTQVKRYQIEAGLARKENQASIAKQLGVSPATISREIRRNGSGLPYNADVATIKSDTRRAQARKFCKPVVRLSQRLPV
jgi:IS30 family transposase